METTTTYNLYTFSIPLRYNSLDMFSIAKDREYVVGLDGELEWTKDNALDIDDTEDDTGKSNAYLTDVLKHYPQYKCRVTSVYRKMGGSGANHEQNTYPTQTDVQRDLDAANINEPVGIEGQDGAIAVDSSYKDYEIAELMNPFGARYQYVMQEYCAALGTEGLRSKYFHLFCIIEFIEREYIELAGAEKLLNDEQIELLCKAFKETLKSTDIDKSVQSNVASGVKGRIMGMTTIGRTQKLVNILHAMGIKNVNDGGVEFDIDKEHMQKHIDTRNTLFHGNDSDKDLRNLVTELMCIDLKVLEYLRNNCDIQK